MARNITRWMSVVCVAFTATALAQDETRQLKTVTAKNLVLRVPQAWKSVPVNSNMRLAQFQISNAQAGADPAELVVFYFGGGPTGGVEANLQRWIGQFQPQNRQVQITSGKCALGRYYLADIAGTWKKPVGPPIAGKTLDTPGSRVMGVVVVVKKDQQEDYYFIKLSGPDGLVASQADTLRVAIGTEADSEQPFRLERAK